MEVLVQLDAKDLLNAIRFAIGKPDWSYQDRSTRGLRRKYRDPVELSAAFGVQVDLRKSFRSRKGTREGAGWSVGIPSDRLIRVRESSKPFKFARNSVHGTKQIKSNSIFRAPLYIVWGVNKQGGGFHTSLCVGSRMEHTHDLVSKFWKNFVTPRFSRPSIKSIQK